MGTGDAYAIIGRRANAVRHVLTGLVLGPGAFLSCGYMLTVCLAARCKLHKDGVPADSRCQAKAKREDMRPHRRRCELVSCPAVCETSRPWSVELPLDVYSVAGVGSNYGQDPCGKRNYAVYIPSLSFSGQNLMLPLLRITGVPFPRNRTP